MPEELNPEKEKAAQESVIKAEKEKTESGTKKFLFINDCGEMLDSLRKRFGSNPNVSFAECHSVEEAVRAVNEYNPDVIFFDHQLTEGGNEGFEIADRVQGKTIYSTTTDGKLAEEYQGRGIGHIKINDVAGFRAIIVPPKEMEEKRKMKKSNFDS
jgi:hypothetical protein